MEFVFPKTNETNAEFIFSIDIETPSDTLELCAVDTYTIYADGEFLAFGPERTAAGYSRKKTVNIKDVKHLEIRLLSFGVSCYECDFQQGFLGATLFGGGKETYTTLDFVCEKDLSRLTDMPRYSGQRGFAEGFDLTRDARIPVECVKVSAPKVISGSADRCDYNKETFVFDGNDIFKGFEKTRTPGFYSMPSITPHPPAFSEDKLIDNFIGNATEYDYHLPVEKSGFLCLDIQGDGEILCVFDEILSEGKWYFRRSCCNDFFYVKATGGKATVITREPYTMKYLKVISSNPETKIVPSLILYQNDRLPTLQKTGNAMCDKVIEAAKNSFIQNSVDLFTDCPGRERAGWLCDSYFSGIAEKYFTGENKIEHAFLENIILSNTAEIASGMLPMCFPSEHSNGRYIPNWAMWFVIELEAYIDRGGDRRLVALAKNKVYKLLDFFKSYCNSNGLLESLDSWVFVEWSAANNYTSGVNYPTNMLYSRMLQSASRLYNDPSLSEEAENVKKEVIKQSFNGKFFVDHSLRENGKLIRQEDHITETCQYYALFMGIYNTPEFSRLIKDEFGPKRKDEYPEVKPSNMFIGYYLRLFWLLSIGEYEKVLDESVAYFSEMAEKTGTLWEHKGPEASCNHGFASSAAVIINTAISNVENTL